MLGRCRLRLAAYIAELGTSCAMLSVVGPRHGLECASGSYWVLRAFRQSILCHASHLRLRYSPACVLRTCHRLPIRSKRIARRFSFESIAPERGRSLPPTLCTLGQVPFHERRCWPLSSLQVRAHSTRTRALASFRARGSMSEGTSCASLTWLGASSGRGLEGLEASCSFQRPLPVLRFHASHGPRRHLRRRPLR